jgi:hypothetical protein
MNDLETRVLDAIPAGAFEMNALLSLLRIEETEDVPTASVSCERRPVLRINPSFVRTHCRSDEHLFLLVMHELHHVLLGHTRLFPRATRAHNIAFDAVINAMLVARFPAEAYRSFFLDLYGAEEGALRLLAPPAARRINDRSLERIHELLYGDHWITSEEVFNAIVDGIGESAGGILLGDHGADIDTWGTDGRVDAAFVDAIRAIVETWPPPETPIRGRSLADTLTSVRVRPRTPDVAVRDVIRRALLGAAQNRYTGALTSTRSVLRQDAVPNARDRHAAVARACGADPMLYWQASPLRGSRSGRARVFLDVSASMQEYVPLLYGALVSLRAHVHPELRQFSTHVAPLSMAKLAEGQIRTTGGTDIGCVLQHMRTHRICRALVITDGYVGTPAPGEIQVVRNSGLDLRIVLTPDGWRRDIESVATRIDELPRVERGTQQRRAS